MLRKICFIYTASQHANLICRVAAVEVDISCVFLYPRSPNAKRTVQQRLTASLENESTGIRRLEPLLLFAGEDDPTRLYQ
jgi:hypothetical protein